MHQQHSNVDSKKAVEVEYDRIDWALRQMPQRLKDLLLFEVGSNVNPVQLVEARNENPFLGPSWGDLERIVREFSYNEHKEAFGGVYPGGRKTTSKGDGPRSARPNAPKQTPDDLLRHFRRRGVRDRRTLRRIAAFFPDLTGG